MSSSNTYDVLGLYAIDNYLICVSEASLQLFDLQQSNIDCIKHYNNLNDLKLLFSHSLKVYEIRFRRVTALIKTIGPIVDELNIFIVISRQIIMNIKLRINKNCHDVIIMENYEVSLDTTCLLDLIAYPNGLISIEGTNKVIYRQLTLEQVYEFNNTLSVVIIQLCMIRSRDLIIALMEDSIIQIFDLMQPKGDVVVIDSFIDEQVCYIHSIESEMKSPVEIVFGTMNGKVIKAILLDHDISPLITSQLCNSRVFNISSNSLLKMTCCITLDQLLIYSIDSLDIIWSKSFDKEYKLISEVTTSWFEQYQEQGDLDVYLSITLMTCFKQSIHTIVMNVSQLPVVDPVLPANIPYGIPYGNTVRYNSNEVSFFVTNEDPLGPLAFNLPDVEVVMNTNSSKPLKSLTSQSWEKPLIDKMTRKPMNRAVTFHNRIKSSGYGKGNLNTINTAKTSKPKISSLKDTSEAQVMYPLDVGMLDTCQVDDSYQHYDNIIKLRYNSNATNIAFLSSNSKDIMMLKLSNHRSHPRHINTLTSFTSHSHTISDIDFSLNKSMFLSTSLDKTCRLWDMKQKTDSPILIINGMNRNNSFDSSLTNGRFYYMDKFVLLVHKASILMFTYELDNLMRDDKESIKRVNKSRSQLVHTWNLSGVSIVAIECINSIKSVLIFASTSDRKVHVLDANQGSILYEFESLHNRPIHCIKIPNPSNAINLPLESYHIYGTMAIDNIISLWDLRQPYQHAIMQFHSHVNRREHISFSFSPCLRYIACGSEDKSIRLFDIRQGREMTKIQGNFKDVVMSIEYNPISPQLAAGSLDGSIKFFCDSNNK